MQALPVSDFSELLLLLPFAEKQARWTPFLQKVVSVTGSDGAGLVAHELRSGTTALITEGFDAKEVALYSQYYARISPWMPKEKPSLAGGGYAVSSESVMSLSQLRRTEFYTDWGRKNCCVFSLGASLGIEAGCFRYLSVSRSEGAGGYAEEELALLHLLAPHLQKAFRLQRAMAEAGDMNRVLDSVSLPVFLLDATGRVLEMTLAAERMVRRGKLFHMAASRELSFVAGIGTPLRVAMGKLESGAAGLPAELFRIVDPESGEAMEAVLMAARAHWLSTRPGYLLTLLNPRPAAGESFRVAGKMFGLTPAEVRFVETLVATGSRDLTRHVLGIAQNTAKAQLSSVFSKTGTSRQGQVIQLFSLLGRLRLE